MTTDPLVQLAMQAGLHESAYVDAREIARRAGDRAFRANQRAQVSSERLAVAILGAQPPLTVQDLTVVLGVALSTAAESRRCPPPHPDGTGRVTVEFIIGPISDQERTNPVFLLKATQRLPLALNVRDGEGNAAAIDGVPVWQVSDPAVGDLQVAEDGKSANLIAGTPISGTITVTCDADLGDGVKTVTTSLDIQIVAGDAVVITIEPGTPEDQV